MPQDLQPDSGLERMNFVGTGALTGYGIQKWRKASGNPGICNGRKRLAGPWTGWFRKIYLRPDKFGILSIESSSRFDFESAQPQGIRGTQYSSPTTDHELSSAKTITTS